MQSGISASQDLHDAFNQLVSSRDQRALLAGIEDEQLLPLTTIPAHAERFQDDLHALQSHLTPTQAAYILLKTDAAAPDGYVAVTYVPNAAPVRQKMLFASTRLTLARELGLERFRQQIFTTEAAELTKDGWAKHEAHTGLDAPLTEEEAGLKGVKDAEAAESMGTGGRRGHVSGRVDVKTGEGVTEALSLLKEDGCRGTLVQLKFALPEEVLSLDSSTDNISPEAVASTIHTSEPRYSFYSAPASGESEIVFIYTCPTSSRIKERMIYSTGRSWTRVVAERDAGIVISRSLEATEPSELLASDLGVGAVQAATEASSAAGGSGFARPKRPGRR
ncbi:actin monomer binding protein-like protein [Teratosphaeria nubilosa]|uniref:Actin monomer binding protein-like protein n=1 Tax=Teratosphaeria nubilosa TaxID=161662 RepID=A0A6G1L1G6_9PEZI|nr:actin monomer binding protein-like protein [Teratosphaeria nubilosa]